MEEVYDLTRIISITMEGMRFGASAGRESLKTLGRLAKSIYCAMKYDRVRTGRARGINPMKKMLKMDWNMSYVKISQENLKRFEKLAKKHGIYYLKMPSYSTAPDKGIVQIMYHTSSAARMESVLETLRARHFNEKDEKVTTEEYIRNSGMDKLTDAQFQKELNERYPEQYKELEGLISEVKKNAALEGRIKEALRDNDQLEKRQSEDYRIIHVSRDQLVKENRDEVMIRTGKDDDSYIWLKKDDFQNWDNGTFAVAVHKDQDIRITNFEETEHYAIKGEEIKYHIDSQYEPVTISKKMIQEETERQYMTKVPGARGKEYLWIDKARTREEHQGKSLKTYLEADATYQIVDADNNFVRNALGRELSGNYAPLWRKDVRKSTDRSQKSDRKTEKDTGKVKKSSKKAERKAPAKK